MVCGRMFCDPPVALHLLAGVAFRAPDPEESQRKHTGTLRTFRVPLPDLSQERAL